jgi:hypothetical protein
MHRNLRRVRPSECSTYYFERTASPRRSVLRRIAFPSLAEGRMVAGGRDLAIRFHRRSLEINPGNANAVRKLEELGANGR